MQGFISLWIFVSCNYQLDDSTHSLCYGLSGSSWWRPGWPCRWSWAHETPFHRSTQASCCEAQSNFPFFCSGALSTSRHNPAKNLQNIGQERLTWFHFLALCCSHNTHTTYHKSSCEQCGYNLLTMCIAGDPGMPDFANLMVSCTWINKSKYPWLEVPSWSFQLHT